MSCRMRNGRPCAEVWPRWIEENSWLTKWLRKRTNATIDDSPKPGVEPRTNPFRGHCGRGIAPVLGQPELNFRKLRRGQVADDFLRDAALAADGVDGPTAASIAIMLAMPERRRSRSTCRLPEHEALARRTPFPRPAQNPPRVAWHLGLLGLHGSGESGEKAMRR